MAPQALPCETVSKILVFLPITELRIARFANHTLRRLVAEIIRKRLKAIVRQWHQKWKDAEGHNHSSQSIRGVSRGYRFSIEDLIKPTGNYSKRSWLSPLRPPYEYSDGYTFVLSPTSPVVDAIFIKGTNIRKVTWSADYTPIHTSYHLGAEIVAYELPFYLPVASWLFANVHVIIDADSVEGISYRACEIEASDEMMLFLQDIDIAYNGRTLRLSRGRCTVYNNW